jgi:hypothetical protein
VEGGDGAEIAFEVAAAGELDQGDILVRLTVKHLAARLQAR